MGLDSVLHHVVKLEAASHYFIKSAACDTFKTKEEAQVFDSEQIEKLMSIYLMKLVEAELLTLTTYPYYSVTVRFYEDTQHPNINIRDELNKTLLQELEMQKALCNFDISEYHLQLKSHYINISEKQETDEEELKNKLAFFQEKKLAINKLFEMIQSEKYYDINFSIMRCLII